MKHAAFLLAGILGVGALTFRGADAMRFAEIPVPPIATTLEMLPGPDSLPTRVDMPDVLTMADGSRVTAVGQWARRREELKRVLEYYAVGRMPPAPGNVRGTVEREETVLDGTVRYRLVRLSFGPEGSLSLNVGLFTPVQGGPFPTIILHGGTPPGAEALPRLPQGPNQGRGENVLVVVGPVPTPETLAENTARAAQRDAAGAADTAKRHADVFQRGYALAIFNPNDCAEDTTLRNLDGSWAFRNTRFFPAYPGYDWGILGAWAWGASRVADYLQNDPSIDGKRLIVTGASRAGKSSMIAAAFDERLMGAPVVTGGAGVGAYRFCGPRGSETLDIMLNKYPNWFSPHLHAFRGQCEKLPFDQHGFIAMCAPRPFIALEGMTDRISLPEAVKQTLEGAAPAYALFGAADRVGVNYASHGHAFTAEDWTAIMDFADKHLRGLPVDRAFDRFPTEAELDAAAAAAGMTVPAVPGRARLNVRDFGAVGDGVAKDTAAFQDAFDACAVAGGGEVLVPAGTYLLGSVQLGNRTILRLEEGTVLRGSPDAEDYPMIDIRWEGRLQPGRRALIHAANVDHIGIVGPGRIEGDPGVAAPQNPRGAVVLETMHCNDVRWEGFTVMQGGNWATHPTFSNDVVVRNLTIRGNRDGIDVDSCRNVLIEGCDIDTGDDAISLKSGRGLDGARLGKPTEDVTIRDCTLACRHFASIGIGSETSAGVRNVRIERCRFNARTHAIYIKTRVGRAGVTENISGEDLEVLGGGFLRINLTMGGNVNTADDPVDGLAGYPSARNLCFTNVRLNNATVLLEGAQIAAEKPVEGLALIDVTGTVAKGITLQHARGVVLRNIEVTGFAGPLLSTRDVSGVGLNGAVPYAERLTLWGGRNLSGWRLFLDDKSVDPRSAWSVKDGVLRLDSTSKGYLKTERFFSNYRLHVEWRWPAEAPQNTNSGVLLHIDGRDAIWPKCVEAQLMNQNAGQMVGMGVDIPDAPVERNRTRAPRLADPSEQPLGEWNSYDIECRGDAIEVLVNGVKQNRVSGLPIKYGAIGLQLEGFPIEFQNVWLEEL